MIRRRVFAVLGAALLVSGLLIAVRGPAARAATTNVNVDDDPNPAIGGVFSPKTVTISVGDTVQWTWTGSSQHSVTADDSSFDSGLRPPPTGPFSHQFNTPGTFKYYCQVHGAPGGSGMSGSVIVQAPAPTSTPMPTSTPTDMPQPTNTPVTSTATPGPTQTASPTGTPGASATAGAATSTPAIQNTPPPATATLPGGGTAGSTRLPRTGGGAAGSAPVSWLSIALAAAGGLVLAAAFGARKRA